jgi:hypothetical protein
VGTQRAEHRILFRIETAAEAGEAALPVVSDRMAV